jgi:hypothetical protein
MGSLSVHTSMLRLAKLAVLSSILILFTFTLPASAQRTDGAEDRDPDLIMFWDFESTGQKTSVGDIDGAADILEGNWKEAKGVKGIGLRLDGFTTCLRRKAEDKKIPSDEFTVEAWVALGNYPWNWCPILTTESDETMGYRLLFGPLGQISLQGAIGEQWISCTSRQEVVPLRRWIHVAGVYRADKDMALYLDGALVAFHPIQGRIQYARNSECRIGMVAAPGKPSDIHRTWGTVPAFYGIDGIVDEIKVFDRALSEMEIAGSCSSVTGREADIEPRRLPTIANHPGRFGAFYTKLKYYPGWDDLWPVEQDPDVVVVFEKSPVKLIFWRGIRYGASWVSENENWMTDQSVEAWEHGDADREGCFEHMQDRHCRFSHVRVIENTPARVVVHWRYAPVSAYDNTWRPDPKTGWECWIDEYYTIYPDATAVRRVSWKKGTLGQPRQFQESLALLHPGQVISDLLEKDFAFVADYSGRTDKAMFVENPNQPPYGPFSWDKSETYTIQQYNFKSEHKPFICFEPGNEMFIRHNGLKSYDKAGGCNHFPVGQARCDGRTTRMADRPSHCSGFPISDPVIHEEGDRFYWCGLYGMKDMGIDRIVRLGRSWAYAPELIPAGPEIESQGFDRSRRCYRLLNKGDKPAGLEFTLKGSRDNPVIDPAFYIKNWNAEDARVIVDGREIEDCEIGIIHELEGSDLAVFLWFEADTPTRIRIIPRRS